jgi:hypothetical protein
MTTLDELRTIVRTQTQTSSQDLPDPTIDVFLQQAFDRTINAETQWPFYEQTWELVLAANTMEMALPGDVNPAGIMALYDRTNNFRLSQIASEQADDSFAGPQVGTMQPYFYSIWNHTLFMWPRVQQSDQDRAYALRGYRRPVSWLTSANEPDCDQRLQLPLTHYAVALAYAQQEDEQLELTYMDRWQRDVELARRAIMEPRHHRPLVFPGSINSWAPSGPTWVLVPPTV